MSEAYSVLSDPEKRSKFDQFGHAAFGESGPFAGGFDFSHGFEDVFGDIFGEFFGGSTRGRARSRAQRGDDLRYNLEVTFEQAAFGTEKKVKIPRHGPCDECEGRGAEKGTNPQTCPACKGSGQMAFQQGFFTVSRTCSQCGGQGRVIPHPCPSCHGVGLSRKFHTINVKIPAGVDTGSRLKLRGEGENGARGGPPGDLYVVIIVQDHAIFARDGTDVICEMPISFVNATLGAEIEVPTLEGKGQDEDPRGDPIERGLPAEGQGDQGRARRPQGRRARPRAGGDADTAQRAPEKPAQGIFRRRWGGRPPYCQRVLREGKGTVRLRVTLTEGNFD